MYNQHFLENNIKFLNLKYKKRELKFVQEGTIVIVKGNSFDVKDELKNYGFKWDGNRKIWYANKKDLGKLDFENSYIGVYIPRDEIKKKIFKYINSVKNTLLKGLLDEIILKKYLNTFFDFPGAKSIHHAYKGGLAEHTLQVLEGALRMASLYDYIPTNRELLITSAILHDIGKIFCYETTSQGIEKTDYLIDFDHIILGITIVSQASVGLIKNEKDQKLFEHLIQIITSHHQLPEWGSPKEPKSPEAWIIHMMDNLSAKIGGNIKNNSDDL